MLSDRELQTLRNQGNEAEAAADEIERLRAQDAEWFRFAMSVGSAVQCLASSFPDANGHILRKVRALADQDSKPQSTGTDS